MYWITHLRSLHDKKPWGWEPDSIRSEQNHRAYWSRAGVPKLFWATDHLRCGFSSADHPNIKRNILSILNGMRVNSSQVTQPWHLKLQSCKCFSIKIVCSFMQTYKTMTLKMDERHLKFFRGPLVVHEPWVKETLV
jgi:hypothetical protein